MRAFALIVLTVLAGANAEIWSGTSNSPSSSGFEFLGKFCFGTTPANPGAETDAGTFAVSLEFTGAQPPVGLSVLLYSDQDESWPAVYKQGKSCASNWAAPPRKGREPLPVKWTSTGDSTFSWTLDPQGVQQHARPRFWFLVLSNCMTANGTAIGWQNVHYEVRFKNIIYSSWNDEFGVNDYGLNSCYLVFFFAYTFLLAIVLYSLRQLYKRFDYMHPLLRLFTTVVLFQWLSVFGFLLHYGTYSKDGRGMPQLEHFSEVMDYLSRIVFILTLMLLAKGWTITPGELTHKLLIVGSVLAFALSYVIVLIWQYAVEDPAATEPDSAQRGFFYFISSLWFLFAIWFVFTCVQSYRKLNNGDKSSLYIKLILMYLPWFAGYPVVLFLSLQLDPWVREKVVVGISLCISMIGNSVLAFLLWPTRAEKYFDVTANQATDIQNAVYNQL